MERLWYGVTHGFPRRHERLGLRSIRVPRVGSKSWLYASIGAHPRNEVGLLPLEIASGSKAYTRDAYAPSLRRGEDI
jgi:hypothetical protein